VGLSYQKDPPRPACKRSTAWFPVPNDGRAPRRSSEETEVDPKSQWILAEGERTQAGMSRSNRWPKPWMTRSSRLYQSGERIRPSNGYPIRLLLSGLRKAI